MPNGRTHIGLIDADLLDGGTRHPNLVLLKLAGFFRDNGYVRDGWEKGEQLSYDLVTDKKESKNQIIDWKQILEKYDHFYMSRVFTFTKLPDIYLEAQSHFPEQFEKFHCGGTGDYANLSIEEDFAKKRKEDMTKFSSDEFLNGLTDLKTGKKGINMRIQMPDYNLYDFYIDTMDPYKKSNKYKDYRYYSIGFLTRGCFRKCSFCVNKLERFAVPYSKVNDFLDTKKDEKGHWARPYIYLWDDNFLSSPKWKEMLQSLIDTGRPFQFRQGLDERLIAQSKRGEEMAIMLSKSNYHGDFIFAFDNWADRKIIVKALNIWKSHTNKETKFYLFCGFHQTSTDDKLFQKDIAEIFMRIKVLMSYGCLGYIMRHEDYKKAPISNIYVQIARWCNQPAFYKKMSFWEFCYRNQTFWEEKKYGYNKQPLKSYQEFMEDYRSGYYDDKKICLPLKSFMDFMQRFNHHDRLFLSLFTIRMRDIYNPNLWTNINKQK